MQMRLASTEQALSRSLAFMETIQTNHADKACA
jgi:hypothetical protein